MEEQPLQQTPPEEKNTPTVEISEEQAHLLCSGEPLLKELKGDVNALLDAVKELTKTVGQLSQEHAKWRAAGKF